jgi:hypothetical protein
MDGIRSNSHSTRLSDLLAPCSLSAACRLRPRFAAQKNHDDNHHCQAKWACRPSTSRLREKGVLRATGWSWVIRSLACRLARGLACSPLQTAITKAGRDWTLNVNS